MKFSRLSHLVFIRGFPTVKRAPITRNNDILPHFKVRHNYFKYAYKIDFRIFIGKGMANDYWLKPVLKKQKNHVIITISV